MIHLRDRSILGIAAIILLIASPYLCVISANINTYTIISSLNIAILFSYLAFGNIGGAVFAVLSIMAALFVAIRTGLYDNLIFTLSFFLMAFVGHAHNRAKAALEGACSLKLEKLDEEINLLSNSINEKTKSITSLKEKLNRYSILKDVTEALSTVLALEEITKLVIEKTLKTLGKRGRALLFLVDTEKQELMLSASRNTDEALKIVTKKGDIFDRWVLRYRKPLIVEDITKDFRFSADDANEAKEYFRSLISAPLISENKIIGILRVDNIAEFAYSQDDLRLLDILSDLGAVAVQNAYLYSKTQELAIRDGLTGLFLRRYFMERFREEIKRAARKRERLSLLILDIDHFKDYNDKYGHVSGDLVLRHLVKIISSMTREGDISARYGGEEMALLLWALDKKEALAKAEAIRQRIEDNPLMLRREKKSVTVSIGVASYPQDGVLEEELIRIADERLYQAKAEGRNRVCG